MLWKAISSIERCRIDRNFYLYKIRFRYTWLPGRITIFVVEVKTAPAGHFQIVIIFARIFLLCEIIVFPKFVSRDSECVQIFHGTCNLAMWLCLSSSRLSSFQPANWKGWNDSGTLQVFYLFIQEFSYNIFNNHVNWEEIDGKEVNCFHSPIFSFGHGIRFEILSNMSTQVFGNIFKPSQILFEFEFRKEEQLEQLNWFWFIVFVVNWW